MSDLTDHPYQLLPPIAAEDLERLRADIAARGVQVPVEVDEDGNILDGHHRKAIADELGIDCPVVVRRGLSESDKRLHAGMLNLARRQLTDGQKVYLGRLLEPEIKQQALDRMGHGRGGPGKQPRTDVLPSSVTQVRDEVAERVGLGSGRTYERGRKVLDWADREAPELVELVAEGKASIGEVNKTLKRRQLEQEAATSQELVEGAVAARPGAAAMLRAAQERARQSAARAAIRRALLDLEPEAVAALADPDDRPGWALLARELMRWGERMGQALERPGLRLVGGSRPPDEVSG